MLVVSPKPCVKANWRPFLLLLAGLLRHGSSVTALLVNYSSLFCFPLPILPSHFISLFNEFGFFFYDFFFFGFFLAFGGGGSSYVGVGGPNSSLINSN